MQSPKYLPKSAVLAFIYIEAHRNNFVSCQVVEEFRMKIIALLVVIGVFAYQSSAGVVEDKTRLLNHLLENYNVDVEPDHADVKFGIGFLCARWDSVDKVLKTTAWERYKWNDNRLVWNPAEYGGVEVVRVHSNNIWTPDFKLYTSLSHEDKRQSSKCVISHDGTVIWVPAVEYKSLCKPEGDGLDCDYKIGSWTEDSNTVSLELWHLPYFTYYSNSTCPLLASVKSAEVVNLHYPCCPEPYASLQLKVHYTKNTELLASFGQEHGHGHRHGRGH